MPRFHAYLPHYALLVREPTSELLGDPELYVDSVRAGLECQRTENAYPVELEPCLFILLRSVSPSQDYRKRLLVHPGYLRLDPDFQDALDPAVGQS